MKPDHRSGGEGKLNMAPESITATLNRCFMRFEDRAERVATKQIIDTFVSVGPLLDVLANRSHQVMYGRRGVGKTHALKYFQQQENNAGNLAVYIDCQNIGSNQSIYDDDSLPISERATRLLIDVCSAMHWAFMDAFSDPSRGWTLSEAAPLLNDFVDALSEVRIVGNYEAEDRSKQQIASEAKVRLSGQFSATPKLSAAIGFDDKGETVIEHREKRAGDERSSIDFNFLMQRTRQLAQYVAPKRIWLLIDEWSTVPTDIQQPYLADLIRRSFFSVPNISVKIAAIEHRSNFKLDLDYGKYIGCELGADISVALNLDDYLVFDANAERATSFFRNLITNHVIALGQEIGFEFENAVQHSLMSYAFTQDNVFVELVKASEGVPRDAMHILANAAQRAGGASISMPTIRQAVLQFFQTDKYNAIASNSENRRLLDWIRHKVINERKTRAFLLPVGTADEIIDRLFDRRALHILSRSMSAAHRPGERFTVYKLDYGCYVDLVNTDKFPHGGLFKDDPNFLTVDFDVPEDDKRSYRRAILNIREFYESQR